MKMGWALAWVVAVIVLVWLNVWRDARDIDARQACRVGGGMVLEVEGGRGFVCLPALREGSNI